MPRTTPRPAARSDNRAVLIASSHEIVNEFCDEQRFEKHISGPLKNVRAFSGDGLFTAYNEEPNWARAHRILGGSLVSVRAIQAASGGPTARGVARIAAEQLGDPARGQEFLASAEREGRYRMSRPTRRAR